MALRYSKAEAKEWAREHLRGLEAVIFPPFTPTSGSWTNWRQSAPAILEERCPRVQDCHFPTCHVSLHPPLGLRWASAAQE